MNELLKSFIENVVFTAILAGGVASFITHWQSRRQFIQERWWNRKADAYAEIIENLVALTYSLERWREYEEQEFIPNSPLPQKPKEDFETARSEYQESMTRLERAVYQGDYIVSINVAETLKELIKQLEEHPYDTSGFDGSVKWINDLGVRFVAAQDCLQVVRDEARSDLRVGRKVKRIKRHNRRTK